jgi:hypothetical protein
VLAFQPSAEHSTAKLFFTAFSDDLVVYMINSIFISGRYADGLLGFALRLLIPGTA